MARHVYTVVEPYRSVGAAGVKEYAAGDEVVLDRPARAGRHLQLLRIEEDAQPTEAAPDARSTTKPATKPSKA